MWMLSDSSMDPIVGILLWLFAIAVIITVIAAGVRFGMPKRDKGDWRRHM